MEFIKSLLCIQSALLISHAVVFDGMFEKELDSFIDTSMKCHNVPGFTLSVIKGNEVWSKGFGKADISANKSVDSDTKFSIGSVTKSFTVTLLGILLSEKGMKWTAKVTDILGPGYGFIDPYRTSEMMLKDLVSHRTGLARLDYGGTIAGFPKSVSRTEFCKRMKYLPEKIPFRDGYIYNNYMVTMAGHVAEILGNDTWENLVRTRIFHPLGMKSTSLLKDVTDFSENNTAQPYMTKDGILLNGSLPSYLLPPLEPAGAIMSTADDMARWLKFHLSMGKTESGQQLLKTELMQEIHRVTTPLESYTLIRPLFPVTHLFLGYNYGLWTQEYRGYRIVGHDGSLGGFQTIIWTFPDANIALFGSVNGPGRGAPPINHYLVVFYHIVDRLLGLEPWLNETTACTFPKPWLSKPAPPFQKLPEPLHVTNLAQFEGTFENKIFPDVIVASNTSTLLLTSNKMHGILHPSHVKDAFLFEILAPLEYSIPIGVNPNDTEAKTYLSYIVFGRDNRYAVDKLTFKMDVDMVYEKKTGPHAVPNIPVIPVIPIG